MNYRIIGTDGREYGPVNQEQIRLWISQGRVNASTLICAEGSLEWRMLGGWPDFQALAPPAPGLSNAGRIYPGSRRTNGWAIWGFVCGLLSISMCSCCCLPLDLFGIVFSIIGLVQINNHPETQSGTTLAILGLVLSILSFAMGFVFSTLWFSSGAAEEFMRELHREFRFGAGQVLGVL